MRRVLLPMAAALPLLIACVSENDFDPDPDDPGVLDPGSEPPPEGSTPVPSGFSQNLLDVWGTSPSNVWATGAGGRVLHFDGTRWSLVSSGTTQRLTGLWGSGADDIWASGDNGTLIHWDGSRWRSASSGTDATLYELSGTSDDDVWAAGEGGTFLHWDGDSWRRVSAGTSRSFYSVWANSPDDAWAVGDDGIILRWNGSAWRESRSAGDGDAPELTWIHGLAGDDIWVGGTGGTVLHFDGSGWAQVSVPDDEDVNFIHAVAPDDVWLSMGGRLLRWNGSTFEVEPDVETRANLRAMWGFPEGDFSPDELFVVGDRGQTLGLDGEEWVPLLP